MVSQKQGGVGEFAIFWMRKSLKLSVCINACDDAIAQVACQVTAA